MRLKGRMPETVLGVVSVVIMALLIGWPLMTFIQWLRS